MALNLPRVSIIVSDPSGKESQGSINLISLGFGLHQAWMYATIFGMNLGMPMSYSFPSLQISSITLPNYFTIAILIFAATLIFVGITDQKFLRLYTNRRVLVASAVLTFLGTAIISIFNISGNSIPSLDIIAGILVGLGSAFLLTFWAKAYARHEVTSIVINTALAMVTAVSVYLFVAYVIPTPFDYMAVALIPLIELPIVFKYTPSSQQVVEQPMFNPLPIKKGSFSVHLALATVLFGLVMGVIRYSALKTMLISTDPSSELFALMLGSIIMFGVLVGTYFLSSRIHWDFLFRPLIPAVIITSLTIPFISAQSSMLLSCILFSGYLIFEGSMWVFFAEMAQEFRISPLLLFGIGRGSMAVGSFFGTTIAMQPHIFNSMTPFGNIGVALAIVVALLIAYGIMPRAHNIREIVGNAPGISALSRMESTQRAENVTPYQDIAIVNRDSGMTMVASTDETEQDRKDEYSVDLVKEDDAVEEETRGYRGARFRTVCEELANTYMLSRREAEVFFLLAKGHNAGYIQEKLCITRSTAKTHIYHIYQKLDIHTQNELLIMIENMIDAQK